MPVKKRFWKRVNIQLSPEQHKRLTKLSAQKGRTFAELAWRAIDEYLEREAEKKQRDEDPQDRTGGDHHYIKRRHFCFLLFSQSFIFPYCG